MTRDALRNNTFFLCALPDGLTGPMYAILKTQLHLGQYGTFCTLVQQLRLNRGRIASIGWKIEDSIDMGAMMMD